jgi:hypothetical protein
MRLHFEPSEASSIDLPSPARERLTARVGALSATAVTYLAAGRLLHAIALGQLLVSLLILCLAGPYGLRLLGSACLGLLIVFTQLDARSRYQEFKKARDQLVQHGPNRRIFHALSGSRCQRDAVLAAAGALGHAAACRHHLKAAGYRWYHLLPDFVKHHPGFLLSPAFLQATFFAPTYRSRFVDRYGNPSSAGIGVSPRVDPAIAGWGRGRGADRRLPQVPDARARRVHTADLSRSAR